MTSFQVRVFDQVEDEMEIETEYDIGQRLMSMQSKQPSSDDEVVQELPLSRVKHVDDEEWEVSSTSKKYLARLKKAKFQRQKASKWNDRQMKAANDNTAHKAGQDPKSLNRRLNIVVDERPFDEQGVAPVDSPQGEAPSLFASSTMSDSDSLIEEEKLNNEEQYHRMINDPYTLSDFSAFDSIPPVVVVSIKSSTSEDHGNMLKCDNTDTTEENDSALLEKLSGSNDSWDILNKYDGQNGTTLEPDAEGPLAEKASNDSIGERDELMGVDINDENMGPAPPTDDLPPPQTKLGTKNNAVLYSAVQSNDWGNEPQPSFGNVLDAPCDEVHSTTTGKKDTAESQKKVNPPSTPGTEEDINAAIDKTESLSNDFPEQSVLELLMQRVEMSKKAKKEADDATVANEQLAKKSESKPRMRAPDLDINKGNLREVGTERSESPPQKEERIQRPGKFYVDSSSPVDVESLTPPQANAESSKALLDSAFKMIARLEKENAEKDSRLRSSSLYIDSLEKKLFEEKTAMEEQRKRRAGLESEEVSQLKDEVSSTLHKLGIEEGKGKSLQRLVNELKEELKQEKNMVGINQEKGNAIKELLESEQSQVRQLQDDLAARNQTLEATKSRVIELKEKLALSNRRTAQEEDRANELRMALEENDAQLEKTMVKLEHARLQLNIQNACEEARSNDEIMEKLKLSIESRQKLIEQEEEKNKELLSKQLEHASLAEDHQVSAKKVEASLEKYYQLIQKEKEEVQRLKDLGKEKEEEIAKEKRLILDLENTIVRKHAMIDLEKVKHQALQSSIDQKGRLVAIESSKMREHKALCAERKSQIETEKEEIRLAIQEKEEMLCSEKAAIEYLQTMISTKKTLREQKKALDKANPSDDKYTRGTIAEPTRAFASSVELEIAEQKLVLQDLSQLRSYYTSK
ncbi:MAG: hypothetical protein SGBAC_004925 [Bacillariaceae sp.]